MDTPEGPKSLDKSTFLEGGRAIPPRLSLSLRSRGLLAKDDEGLPVLSAGAPFKAGGRGGASYY
ncbi:hypothetical protein P4S95_26700, partial [Aneurinibacillus aneurinilyticus]|uniref:hypothetical protein n=1 Tax=Aneurinibacillus aneurinilyticus TaxID=1391 RepID=UPI002E1BB280|nr:hypothetical protein [Aneurinibacillus aneurinilyticus]